MSEVSPATALATTTRRARGRRARARLRNAKHLTCPQTAPRLPTTPNRSRARRRAYSPSEVIHRAGDESLFPAFEPERPRIVNNFAASASSGYEWSCVSEKMNCTRLSNLAVVLGSANEYSDKDESVSGDRLRLAIRNSHPTRAARTTITPLLEYERICLRATG